MQVASHPNAASKRQFHPSVNFSPTLGAAERQLWGCRPPFDHAPGPWAADASTPRASPPAAFPLHRSGVAGWNFDVVSFPQGPRLADLQRHPLAFPSGIGICPRSVQSRAVPVILSPPNSERVQSNMVPANGQISLMLQRLSLCGAGQHLALAASTKPCNCRYWEMIMTGPALWRPAGRCRPCPTPPMSRRRWRCRGAPAWQGRER